MRLLKYLLNEIFETEVPIKIKRQSLEYNLYTFEIKDIKYVFKASNDRGTWEISFGQKMGIGITNTGDAFRVFSNITRCLDIFLKKYKPWEFWFTAKEPSRKKLYNRFAKTITKKYPYVFRTEDSYGEDVFIFKRNG